MKKPHLYFRNPVEGVVTYKPHQRKVGDDEGADEPIEIVPRNYLLMQESFRYSLTNFTTKRNQRETHRNLQLNIPAKVDYIILNFFDYFDSSKYENKYREYFGLSPIRYDEFNTIGYYAISNEEKFQEFIDSINVFINSVNPDDSEDYNRLIRYIKRFDFHSSDDIKKIAEPKDYYILDLFESLELYPQLSAIKSSLIDYCSSNGLNFIQDVSSNRIELLNVPFVTIQEIVDNYDVIHIVNSPFAGIIRPSVFNLPIREYGFAIANGAEDLPIIGIIDTGISSATPLAPLIINDGNEFDITGTSPKIDSANHGTGVSAIAALGKSLYNSSSNQIIADAKLLSIKVLDREEGYISESLVISMIKESHQKYGIKIFVLSLGYCNPLPNNSLVSNYACTLDSLSNELNILIFISVGNFTNFVGHFFDNENKGIYPHQFLKPDFNLRSPSESMNNIGCGAISDNLEPYSAECYSAESSFPASYTRKFNCDRSASYYKSTRFSKHLTKPDLCYFGGDIDNNTLTDNTGLKVLSAEMGQYYSREIGTSYSAPFLANLAAKILKEYPQLAENMQTIKALLVNSAEHPQTGKAFKNLEHFKLQDLIGKGIPDDNLPIYSDENNVTLVLEDSIKPGHIKTYSLKLPEYLVTLLHGKSVVHIDATLCFSFEPIPHNHLAYCPVHISFGIFKDIALEEKRLNDKGKEENFGLSGARVEDFKVFQGWSEDYYFKAKLLSNCHKMSFGITKNKLLKENNQFKIAIHSKLHKLLPAHLQDDYNILHKFSLVITVKEMSHKGAVSNRLYNELILINNLEVIAELEAELEN